MRMSRHLGVYAANRVYLYKRGNTCDILSGGWSLIRGSSNPDGALTLGSEYMQLSGVGAASNFCGIATSKIDFSKYSKLCFLAETTNRNEPKFGFYTDRPGGTTLPAMAAGNNLVANNTQEVVTVDLTSSSPEGYPAILTYANGSRQTTKIYEIWLER